MAKLFHAVLLKKCSNILTASRHITAHDRIIYDIYDDKVTVLIVQAEDHYNDK